METPASTGEEVWFYRRSKNTGAPLRFRLAMTEDQRQICTGEGLTVGLEVDDCETGLLLDWAACKNFSLATAKLLDGGAITIPDPSDGGKASSEHLAVFMSEVYEGKHKPLVESFVGDEIFSRMARRVGADEKKDPRNQHDDYTSKCHMFGAMANLCRSQKIKILPCVGTANSAAPGTCFFLLFFMNDVIIQSHSIMTMMMITISGLKAQLSGHCFGVAECTFHQVLDPDKKKMLRVMEPTRWVFQSSRKPGSPGYVGQEMLKKLNQLPTLMMELTKLGTMSPLFDSGVALTRMYQGKVRTVPLPIAIVSTHVFLITFNHVRAVILEQDNSFYRNIYVCGDSVQILKKESGDIVIGASVEDVVDGRTTKIPVRYDMIASHVTATTGERVDGSYVKEFQAKMIQETTCPGWSKKKWDMEMQNCNYSQVV